MSRRAGLCFLLALFAVAFAEMVDQPACQDDFYLPLREHVAQDEACVARFVEHCYFVAHADCRANIG